MIPFRGAPTRLVLTTVSGALLSLVSTVQAPRAQQIITYADGEVRTAPIDVSQLTQLQVATGTATQSGFIFDSNPTPPLQKAGAGTLVVTGANIYSNQTTILSGALNIQNNTALGATGGGAVASGTIVSSGAALEIQGNITVGAEALLLNGTGIGGGGALRNISGNNSYGGAITLNSAVRINSDSGVLTLGNINVTAVGQNLAVGGAGNTTVSGVIATGTGTLTKDGTGTLTLTNASFYQGSTTISAGVLNIRNGNALGTGAGGTTVGNGAALELQQGIGGSVVVGPEALTLNGTGIADSGALRNVSGNNVYGGPITLSSAARINSDAGTLTLGSSIAGLGQNLTVGGAGNTIISRAISIGTGSLTKDGAGTLILAGNNAYSGGTTVLGGTLQGNTTSLQDDITNNANVAFDQAGNGTYAGNISGSGTVVVSGGGTVTFSGANGYSGATAIDSGTLALAGGDISSSSGVTVASGATFDITGNVGFTAIRNLAGAGTVQLNDGLVLTNASGTFAGVIAGSGASSGLTVAGGGTFTLTGVNTYTGPTQINAGTTLALSGSGSIANTSFVGVLGTLDISQTTSGASVGGLFAGGTVSLGGKTLTITNGSTFSGVIQDGGIGSGSGGSLVISAPGFGQDLSGVNAYTGSTTITAGALLTLSGNGSIASSSGLNLAGAGATFDISAANGNVTIKDLVGVAGSTIQIGGNSLVVGTANSTTFAGVIDDSSSPGGALIKQGTGTLTLSGANTYTGGTQLNAGTLAIANNSALGTAGLAFSTGTTLQAAANGLSVGNDMRVAGISTVDTQANTLALGGVITGTGTLTKIGTGTLILTGTNNYTGGTTVSAGILQGTTSSLQGNILNNAQVTINQATNGTYAGNMSGTGGLLVNGTGTVILSGSNSYSGGTLVTGGILQGTTSSLQGTIVNNAQVTIQQSTTGAYAGNMSGVGSLLVNGGGTVILTGVNSYTGGTTVAATSTLQGNSASLQGNILNNGAVVFNQTGSGTYAGNMSGTGTLTLQGGTLILTGNNTLTAGTSVFSGSTLVVNGSLTGATTLFSGSMLGGTGTTGTLVAIGATVAPGNSIGTLTVNGNFAHIGGTYAVEANAQGQSDRMNVSGTATISNGVAVQVTAASGNYANSTTYTILNATGGVTGTYSSVTSNFAFLTPSLSYNANNVFLTLALQGAAFSGFGGNTVNQRAVGSALDQSYASATGDFATVIGALAGLNTQQGPYTLNQISGQPYADFGTFNVANNAMFMNALGQQMALARGGQGSGQR
ncbi:MAG: autotransporter-associated beta strand repeat-containing protein, partial [Rhodospirillales bacterium]|nr:autotransporter-associated beta strand repeat-containing protein [Rhodospirillales bacterium]